MVDESELRKLAEDIIKYSAVIKDDDPWSTASWYKAQEKCARQDFAKVANPQAILHLLDALEALRKENARLVEVNAELGGLAKLAVPSEEEVEIWDRQSHCAHHNCDEHEWFMSRRREEWSAKHNARVAELLSPEPASQGQGGGI